MTIIVTYSALLAAPFRSISLPGDDDIIDSGL